MISPLAESLQVAPTRHAGVVLARRLSDRYRKLAFKVVREQAAVDVQLVTRPARPVRTKPSTVKRLARIS